MKSKISCWRFVKSLGMSMRLGTSFISVERVFAQGIYPGGRTQPSAFRGYTRRRPRADGGIGRRARLRAWSGITGWRFESSSAHQEKGPHQAGLSRSGRVPLDRTCGIALKPAIETRGCFADVSKAEIAALQAELGEADGGVF